MVGRHEVDYRGFVVERIERTTDRPTDRPTYRPTDWPTDRPRGHLTHRRKKQERRSTTSSNWRPQGRVGHTEGQAAPSLGPLRPFGDWHSDNRAGGHSQIHPSHADRSRPSPIDPCSSNHQPGGKSQTAVRHVAVACRVEAGLFQATPGLPVSRQTRAGLMKNATQRRLFEAALV